MFDIMNAQEIELISMENNLNRNEKNIIFYNDEEGKNRIECDK